MNNELNIRSIGRLISILYRHSRVYFQRKLAPYGLGHGQIPLLMFIINNNGVSQHEINTYFQLDKGSTSTLISNMEKNGFVRKVRDDADKRSYKLFVTGKTRELLPELKSVFGEWTNILTYNFSESQKEEAFALLNKMIENSEHYIAKL
ncbi:MAG: MarR family winged helix-turn-helix transcriptional regulator [Bacteroidales bacterium]